MSDKTMTPTEVLAVLDEWITANTNNRPRTEPKVRMDRELEQARAAVAALVAENARLREALSKALPLLHMNFPSNDKDVAFKQGHAALTGAGQ